MRDEIAALPSDTRKDHGKARLCRAGRRRWIPAFAGMTEKIEIDTS